MDIVFSPDGQVIISMTDYLKYTKYGFPEPLDGRDINIPAMGHIFYFRVSLNPLLEEKGRMLHNVVSKFLCVVKRDRPNPLTSVLLLSTRVKKPDEDDC